LVLAAIAWASSLETAWAQAGSSSGGSGTSGGLVWVTSYAIVLLGIFLGVFSVVISSRRRERAKQDAFGDRTK
jgi:hypothetical protein